MPFNSRYELINYKQQVMKGMNLGAAHRGVTGNML